MQIHYRILWVDDEIQKLKDIGDVDGIAQFLEERGFQPILDTFEDGLVAVSQLDQKKYDLIISDFDLAENHHGSELVKNLRTHHVLSEVLLYSSKYTLVQIAQAVVSLERISFHSSRRGLSEKIQEVISLSVHKLLELNSMRGLIMAETSELDQMIHEIFLHVINNELKKTVTEKDAIIENYVASRLEKAPEKFREKYRELGFDRVFPQMEAMRKWNVFRDFLKPLKGKKEVQQFLAQNRTYDREVIDIRNKFAHAKSIEREGRVFLTGFGADGTLFEIDAAASIRIRKDLIRHRHAFESLASALNVKFAT